jgi:cobalt/nickel transport system permease protein
MNNPFQERYQAGDSPLHRLDPRVKLVMTLALIVGVVLTPVGAWPAYPLLWALIASLAVVGGVGARRAGQLAGLALPFTLTAVTLMFTTPGTPVWTGVGLTITDAGLARFVTIVLKSWLAVQAALLLSMTTPFTDLLWALSTLRVPQTLVSIIAFMYRYLFTLKDEAQRLMRGRAARSAAVPGTHSGGSLFWRARIAGGMIGSLFLRSYERSERVYAAMLARGYHGDLRALDPPPLTWSAIWRGCVPVMLLVLIEILAVALWSS